MKIRSLILTPALWGLAASPVLCAPAPAALESEPKLIAVLQSEAPLFEKARACQQLAVVGTPKAVPVLASLLGHERLGDYARYALEPIEDASVDEALRAALDKLKGRNLAGVVNSIGVRRDAKAVDALKKLVRDPGKGVGSEALAALGRIASEDAVRVVHQSLSSGPKALQTAAAEACLACAWHALRHGKPEEATKLFESVRKATVPSHLREAARSGALEVIRSANTDKTEQPASTSDASFFNGKDLTGWKGTAKYWKVEDGAIVGHSAGKIPHNEFLWSEVPVTDFYLVVHVKLEPDAANAGIQFRSKKVDDRGQALGYQADVGRGMWGRLYHEHGRGKLDWKDHGEKAVKPGDWNRYEILAVGDRIWTAVNGTLSVALRDPEGERSGQIALQIHSGEPQTVRYRIEKLVHRPAVRLVGMNEEQLNAALRAPETKK